MDKNKKIILLRRASIFILIVLIFIYILLNFFNENIAIKLYFGLFPELAGGLIIYLFIDYLLLNDLSKEDISQPLTAEFAKSLKEIEINIQNIKNKQENIAHSIFTNEFQKFLISGVENNKSIKWDKIINNTNNSLEIIVNYFDTWLTNNKEIIIEFLNKEGSKLTVIIPNIENEEILKNLEKIMPKHTKSQIIKKVKDTEEKLLDLIKKESISSDKLKILKCNINFNFTMQIFDKRHLYFSVVEMKREQKFKSPFFIIDLSENKIVEDFFNKEINGLKENSI